MKPNKSEFIIPKHILLPLRSVCQYLALSPVWLWDSLPPAKAWKALNGKNWTLQAAAVGREGNEVSCAICIPPGFLTSISKRKWGRDFLPWFLLSPAIVGAEKEHKNTCKDRSRRKIGLIIMVLMMKLVLWFNSWTWDWLPATSGVESISCLLGKSCYRLTECNYKADTLPGLWIYFSESAKASSTVTDHNSHLWMGHEAGFIGKMWLYK